jgi:hypothetical protein
MHYILDMMDVRLSPAGLEFAHSTHAYRVFGHKGSSGEGKVFGMLDGRPINLLVGII